jgi:hypothetical protein
MSKKQKIVSDVAVAKGHYMLIARGQIFREGFLDSLIEFGSSGMTMVLHVNPDDRELANRKFAA